jgi:sulfide dehydrogenase cytochrome subunit
MIFWWLSKALLIGMLALPCLVWAAPPSPMMLSIACSGCHGTLGASASSAMPSLGGQSKEYFVGAMKAFRSGVRPSTVMGRLAKGYTDAEIEAMAGFYARFKAAAQRAPADARLVEKGRAVFYKRCRFCHLDRGPLWREIHRSRDHDPQCRHCHAEYGSRPGEPTPSIAGQGVQYLSMELDAFRSGVRPMSADKARSVKTLTSEDIEAVAHFYASQVAE